MSVVIARTTVNDEAKAHGIARGAVEAGLSAAADVETRTTPCHRANRPLRHERGHRVSCTTTPQRAADLQACVHERHPYDVPRWIVFPAAGAAQGRFARAVNETDAGRCSS
ncbi:divalent cation tolerance protein CutA [Streptomyces sp. NPDC090021]|uniref:divalent cation tolerance protein CutA n=1 Tax=Streptomyces sp. NPDC090021 TaxID=3365919 RepID=UPI003800DB0F